MVQLSASFLVLVLIFSFVLTQALPLTHRPSDIDIDDTLNDQMKPLAQSPTPDNSVNTVMGGACGTAGLNAPVFAGAVAGDPQRLADAPRQADCLFNLLPNDKSISAGQTVSRMDGVSHSGDGGDGSAATAAAAAASGRRRLRGSSAAAAAAAAAADNDGSAAAAAAAAATAARGRCRFRGDGNGAATAAADGNGGGGVAGGGGGGGF